MVLFFQDGNAGAQSTIYCAVSEEMEGVSGKYIEECRIASPAAHARDDVVARKLWDESAKITRL
jgi:hypothetical protein